MDAARRSGRRRSLRPFSRAQGGRNVQGSLWRAKLAMVETRGSGRVIGRSGGGRVDGGGVAVDDLI